MIKLVKQEEEFSRVSNITEHRVDFRIDLLANRWSRKLEYKLHGMNQNQCGIKDPWGGISFTLQYTAVWVKTRGTLVVKDGQTVEKPTVTG